MQAVPQLSNIRQVSDGWIKKYMLAYTMPDGSTYEYESASRKSLEAYRAELEGNAVGRACAADAVCIVPQTATGELLLIREFRYPLNSWCIAFPAGLIDFFTGRRLVIVNRTPTPRDRQADLCIAANVGEVFGF